MEPIIFSKELNEILEKIDYSRLGKNVAIKLHFGEKGNQTYLNPEIAKQIYEKLISLGKKATLVETNALYKGGRTNRTDHIKTAKSHGFDFAPIDILDGELGEEFVEVEGRKLGKGLKKYDSLLVLTHFKGHMFAGFGGAIKNLSMGLASRAGKLDMHSKTRPIINSKKCSGCGNCIKHCNAKAIILENNYAIIDRSKCEGCAMCIAVCPNNAVAIPWGSKNVEELQRALTEYAKAGLKIIPKEKRVYINVLKNITPDCDCMDIKQKPMTEDIGFLLGYDPVAIDQASLDLVNKEGFDKINKINKQAQINYAEEIGLGKKEYKII